MDEVKSWIKKTVTGKGFKRNSLLRAASSDSVDEDGEVRRKSWSFRVTPDGTPSKSRGNSIDEHNDTIASAAAATARSVSKDGLPTDNELQTQQLQADVIAANDSHAAAVDSSADSTAEPLQSEVESTNSIAALTINATNTDVSNSGNTTTTSINENLSGKEHQPQQEVSSPGPKSPDLPRTPSIRVQLRTVDRQASTEKLSLTTPSKTETYDRTKLRAVGDLRRDDSKHDLSPVPIKLTKVESAVKAEPVVVVPEVVIEEVKVELVIEFFPFEVLVARNLSKQFDGLVLGELERHLSDEEFKKHFGVTRVSKDACVSIYLYFCVLFICD